MEKHIRVTEDIIQKAKDWNDFGGNQHTIRPDKRESSIVGNLGEICFQQMYPSAECISKEDSEADFILKGRRIDVKTKSRSCFARPHYEASVEARLRGRDCDWFVFFSYNNPVMIMEYCGWFAQQEYFQTARFLNAGDTDTSNYWIVPADCYQMQYKDLKRRGDGVSPGHSS